MEIFTNGNISLDGQPTGYGYAQEAAGTKVFSLKTGERVTMPLRRYRLTVESGRALFERHLRDALQHRDT